MAAQGHLGPAIEPMMTTLEVVDGRAEIRLAYFPIYPSTNLAAVYAYSSTEQSPQNEPHGRWPYEGVGTTFPEAYGWVKLSIPLPAALPAKVAIQLAGEWGDGYVRTPARISWENGEPQFVPSEWGTVVTLSSESVALGAPSIQSSAVEYKHTEGGWAYRFAVTLGGDVLSQPQYGGSDIYVRFADESEPSDASGWALLRGIAEHRPGIRPRSIVRGSRSRQARRFSSGCGLSRATAPAWAGRGVMWPGRTPASPAWGCCAGHGAYLELHRAAQRLLG